MTGLGDIGVIVGPQMVVVEHIQCVVTEGDCAGWLGAAERREMKRARLRRVDCCIVIDLDVVIRL